MGSSTAHLELNVQPDVEFVSVIRRFVSEFYRRCRLDADGTSRCALATHELLENVVKYSTDGGATIRIEVEMLAPRTVTITMRNEADDEHVSAIREILHGLASAETPLAYYLQLIAAKAKEKDVSGLGLARISAEAEMTITHRVVEGNMTELVVKASVEGAN